MSDFSNALLVESGGNLVRWMHVTPPKQEVESCDRVGLIQSMPAGDSEKDVGGQRWEERVALMRDAIIYNRNNPSIVFYESLLPHIASAEEISDGFQPNSFSSGTINTPGAPTAPAVTSMVRNVATTTAQP